MERANPSVSIHRRATTIYGNYIIHFRIRKMGHNDHFHNMGLGSHVLLNFAKLGLALLGLKHRITCTGIDGHLI